MGDLVLQGGIQLGQALTVVLDRECRVHGPVALALRGGQLVADFQRDEAGARAAAHQLLLQRMRLAHESQRGAEVAGLFAAVGKHAVQFLRS